MPRTPTLRSRGPRGFFAFFVGGFWSAKLQSVRPASHPSSSRPALPLAIYDHEAIAHDSPAAALLPLPCKEALGVASFNKLGLIVQKLMVGLLRRHLFPLWPVLLHMRFELLPEFRICSFVDNKVSGACRLGG